MAQRIRITLRAELTSALHILGPGRTAVLLDRSIELDLQGYPLIPASSIRGRVRVHLERLLNAWGKPVCTPPSPDKMCPHYCKSNQAPDGGYCFACRIFGSSWHPSGISNSDLHLVEKERFHPDLLRSQRTSVAISRRLGIAQSGALLFTETTVRDIDNQSLCFEGMMQGRLSKKEAGWLLAGVRLVTHAGGSKARGLGEMRLSATEVLWWQEGRWQAAEADKLIEEALGNATT